MNKNVIVKFMADVVADLVEGVSSAIDPDIAAGMLADELIARLNAAEQQAAVDKNIQLAQYAQELANDYFGGNTARRVPVAVEIAALIRLTWSGTIQLPADMGEHALNTFARDLYGQWEEMDFTTQDPFFFERGSCSAEYV